MHSDVGPASPLVPIGLVIKKYDRQKICPINFQLLPHLSKCFVWDTWDHSKRFSERFIGRARLALRGVIWDPSTSPSYLYTLHFPQDALINCRSHWTYDLFPSPQAWSLPLNLGKRPSQQHTGSPEGEERFGSRDEGQRAAASQCDVTGGDVFMLSPPHSNGKRWPPNKLSCLDRLNILPSTLQAWVESPG